MNYDLILEWVNIYLIGMVLYIFFQASWKGFRETGLFTGFSFKEIIFYPIHFIQWLGYLIGYVVIFIISLFIK